jgi:hypothetical protein
VNTIAGRIRWTLISLAFAVLLTAAVVIFSGGPERAPRTWVVQPGHRLVLSAEQVVPDDRYRCPGKGGVNGTPEPNHGVGGSGGLSVETRADGTVIASCEPGPPGNV